MPCSTQIRTNEVCPDCGWKAGDPEPHPIITVSNAKFQLAAIEKERREIMARLTILDRQYELIEKGEV